MSLLVMLPSSGTAPASGVALQSPLGGTVVAMYPMGAESTAIVSGDVIDQRVGGDVALAE
jgi:hypothetical protein